MAVLHDALSENSATDSVSFTADTSWTHTPVGTPKGVVVAVTQPLASGDQVAGVTYGGVALTRVRSDARTVTEAMRVYLYFLGSGIPTGSQTVAVTVGGVGTAAKHGYCMTMTAAAGLDTAVDAHNGADLGIIANPSVTVAHTGSLTGWAGYCAHGYGGSAVVTTGLQTGETYQAGHDPGVAVGMVYTRHGGAATASSTYGYTTLASDDQLIAALVVKEIQPPVGLSGTSTTTTAGSGTTTVVPPAKWADPDYAWGTRTRSWIGWPTEHRSITFVESDGTLAIDAPLLVTAVGFNTADTVEEAVEASTVTSGAALMEMPLAGTSTTTTAGAGTLGTLAGPNDAPDAILAATNLAGTVTDIQDAPDTPGPEWLTAPDENAVTFLRVSFPTPTIAPGVTGGPVRFQVLVRKTDVAGATNPTVDLELWEAGTLKTVLAAGVPVTSVDGQIVEATMNPADLTDPTGADAQLAVRTHNS